MLEIEILCHHYCKNKEHQKLCGVTMQHVKTKVVFKREGFSIFPILGNIRSLSLMTHCGYHTAGDALQVVTREKNPFTENLERRKIGFGSASKLQRDVFDINKKANRTVSILVVVTY